MIGLLDSGVGGLFTLRALRRHLPQADLIYFGDTRHLPYGEKTDREIITLARAGTRFLAAQGAGAVLFACGTASSIALPPLQGVLPFPLLGSVVPTATAAGRAYRGGRILLLGTAATIRAGHLGRMVEKACRAPLDTLACPQLVHMAEAGEEAGLAALLAPQRAVPPAMIILGCTHFSFFAQAIARLFPAAVIIDSAEEAARAAAKTLPLPLLAGQGLCRLYTSGNAAAFARRAQVILGEQAPVYPVREPWGAFKKVPRPPQNF